MAFDVWRLALICKQTAITTTTRRLSPKAKLCTAAL
jgi:hypothetical protein